METEDLGTTEADNKSLQNNTSYDAVYMITMQLYYQRTC